MSRTGQFLTFVGIVLAVMGLVHFYVWARLVEAPAPPPAVKRTLTALFVLLFLTIPLSFYATRGDVAARRWLALPGYVWLGALFLLFATVLAVDVVRVAGALVQRLVSDLPPEDPARRVSIARLVAAGIALVSGTASAAALRSGLGPVSIRTVTVRLPRLPKTLHGTTIVQLSDIHVGPTIGRDFIEDIVSRVNALQPDLVAITGDLVDGTVPELWDAVSPLEGLRSRFGTYFVTGNHEYYSGADSWCAALPKLGIQVLRNSRVSIGESPDASFDLAGVDDHDAKRFGGGENVERAVSGRDPNRELVLLAHQPRAAFQADRHGVGLQLSGHTHGGQIWPWRYLVYLQQPIVSGLGKVGKTLVYVSSGTGYWGPPMRLAAPAEITKIILESA
ncbi:MAG TPA: metallophosphoesterase [Polyangiaceae bacterium]|nr:metallophosphoesterase [Polyangiaceae bacterium]